MLMGAGYASGVVFFGFVARGGRWLDVSFGFVGIAVFSTLMGIATIIHWEKFNHDHPAFIGWLVLYAVAPFLIPGLWVSNGGWRPGPAVPPDREVPRWARGSLAVLGGGSFAIGLVIFVEPSLAIDHWPLDVSPLTARVVSSFLALNVGWAVAALDGRWSAIRTPCLSQLAGLTLLLLGILPDAETCTRTGRPPGSTSRSSPRCSHCLVGWSWRCLGARPRARDRRSRRPDPAACYPPVARSTDSISPGKRRSSSSRRSWKYLHLPASRSAMMPAPSSVLK
jgi:hypothetical protein